MSRSKTKTKKKSSSRYASRLGSGKDLIEMFSAGTLWLEKNARDIDAINVFPVPDGDCGKNMLLTMRSAIENANEISDRTTSSVMEAIARGALMGARGNSGFILSQILEGMAKVLERKDGFTTKDLAQALDRGAKTAEQALSEPKEGTILTVARDTAAAAQKAVSEGQETLGELLDVAVKEAEKSVERTPALLPALREAGVVDAGGEGLLVLLKGALSYLRGTKRPRRVKPTSADTYENLTKASEAAATSAYCTQFLLRGQELNADEIRDRLAGEGNSLIVVGNTSKIRVHLHTDHPDRVAEHAKKWGTLSEFKTESLEDQKRDFIFARNLEKQDIAVVAVALGRGMEEAFRNFGAIGIVSGGQTMNPSIKELLRAVESVPQDKVIILPNNKNIILTASKVAELSDKQPAVIPTKTMPQGIAALIAFNPEDGLEQNAAAMKEAASNVTTIQVTRAVRKTKINELPVEKGQTIALRDDDELLSAGDKETPVIMQALARLDMERVELLTMYYGDEVEAKDAEEIVKQIRRQYPGKEFDLVNGGQPHYRFLLSLE
jgi:DAK2 domain fusion protein YloV